MLVYVFVFDFDRVRVRVRLRLRFRLRVRLCIRLRVCLASVFVFGCVFVNVNVCVSVFDYVFVYNVVSVFVYLYISVYVYMHGYDYVYVFVWLPMSKCYDCQRGFHVLHVTMSTYVSVFVCVLTSVRISPFWFAFCVCVRLHFVCRLRSCVRLRPEFVGGCSSAVDYVAVSVKFSFSCVHTFLGMFISVGVPAFYTVLLLSIQITLSRSLTWSMLTLFFIFVICYFICCGHVVLGVCDSVCLCLWCWKPIGA